MIARGVLYEHRARPQWGPGLVMRFADGKAEIAWADGELRTIREPERFLVEVEGEVEVHAPKSRAQAKPRQPAKRKPPTRKPSAADLEIRRLFDDGYADEEIAAVLGLTVKQIRDRRFRLRLRRLERISADEKTRICALRRDGKSIREIAAITGRSTCGIEGVLTRLGVRLIQGSGWRDQEGELRDMHQRGCSDAEIADALGRSVTAVKAKRGELGLVRRERGDWSDPADVERLLELEHLSHKEAAAVMGRTVDAVKAKRARLRAQGVLS